MDRLSLLLERFSLSASTFYSGQICGSHPFERDERLGHVHLIRRGPVDLFDGPRRRRRIVEPTLIYYPRPEHHRLVADDDEGADVVCATLRFGAGGRNPISDSLPAGVVVPLSELQGASRLLELLYEEAFGTHCGRQAAVDRLCELLLIRLLRHCLRSGLTNGGALAGLADRRIAPVILAIHDNPARPWDLPSLAAIADMSRARFALHFQEVIGQTPGHYLAQWRISVAQHLLRSGRPLKHVAQDVGYGSASALTRSFSRLVGSSPGRWLRALSGERERPTASDVDSDLQAHVTGSGAKHARKKATLTTSPGNSH